MNKRWTVTEEMNKAHLTQVFCGGACNTLDAEGNLLRSRERDAINDWLSEKGIVFFDPQIHPDTHGCEYNYQTHHKLEVAARDAAKVNLFEVSPLSFGGITSLEIAADHFRWQEPTVIYFSDGDPDNDMIPAHSNTGHPLFVPSGIMEKEQAMTAHYREFVKNGNHMRKYLMRFAREMDTLTATFGDPLNEDDIAISPDRMHAADLFKAVVLSASGKRVMVTFTGGKEVRDEMGNPLFIVPKEPPEIEKRALLDQYVDEGNALRRSIAELVRISVFLRVVYTQRSAILALEELLRVKAIMN